jgi:alditol oxidase
MPAFQQLLMKYDPNGKFRNAFLNKYIFNVEE